LRLYGMFHDQIEVAERTVGWHRADAGQVARTPL